MEELLEQAKQMFPIGTVYDNSNLINSGGKRTISSIPFIRGSSTIRVADGPFVERFLYRNGKWATIISSPINKEPTYEIY